MRRSLALSLLASTALFVSSDASAAPPAPPATEFQLLTGYGAKEACSCVFVEGQTDAYCTNYAVLPTGYSDLKIVIDHTANTVTATFVGNSRTAAFTSGQGCVLAGF